MNELIQQQLDVGLNPHFDHCNPFRIADFGCSTGRNTYIAAQNIIEAVEQKYESNEEDPQVPEFFVFFNDLVQNDFNTLFNYIHSNKPNYFGAGVPGIYIHDLFRLCFVCRIIVKLKP